MCKLDRYSWQLPCEITAYRLDFNYGKILFSKEFKFVTTFEFRRQTNKTDVYCDIAFD